LLGGLRLAVAAGIPTGPRIFAVGAALWLRNPVATEHMPGRKPPAG
jgi:hypothetical protein